MLNHGSRPLMSVVLLACALVIFAATATAETVVLKSGTKLKAARVELEDGAVRATMRKEGGTAIVTLPFARLDPEALVALMGRHLPEDDGASQLRIARMAMSAGLHDEAIERFERAATLDKTLATESEQGVATVRGLQVEAALTRLESMLRERRPAEMLMDVELLSKSELAGSLTTAQVLRVEMLANVADAMLKKAGVPVGAPPVAAPVPAPPLDAKTAAVLERVTAYETKALHAREAAADPDLSASKARRHLNAAAVSLQRARKLLIKVESPAPSKVVERADRVRDLLVTTYLDVAELYRASGAYTQARSRLRAVNILDPDNERAVELARAIEEDLRAPYLHETDLYDYPFSTYRRSLLHNGLYYPGAFVGRVGFGHLGFGHLGHHHGHGHRGGFHVGISHGGFGFRVHRHYGASHHGHHVRRVIGTRRSP